MIEKNEMICPGFSSYNDTQLSINLDKIDDIVIVKLDGFIDTYNARFFTTQMEKVAKISKKTIIDFSNIDYMSSSGIGALNEVNKSGNVVLLKVQSKIREILQLLGFDQLFEITYSIDEAIKLVNANKKTTFPKLILCPSCKSKLKTIKSGKFRCPKCKSFMTVDDNGKCEGL